MEDRLAESRYETDSYEATDSLGLYLDQIGQYPLLTAEEELELYEQIEQGRKVAAYLAAEPEISEHEQAELEAALCQAQSARQRFINSNLRLVVSIAKRYQPERMDPLDVIQEGNLGLEHAVDKFDGRKGFKFSTYATWWIKQAIVRGIHAQNRIVRVPSNTEEDMRSFQKIKDDLTVELKRRPSYDELAERMGSTKSDVIKLDSLRHRLALVHSLDKTYGEGEGTLLDVVAADLPNEEQDRAADLEAEVSEVLDSVLGKNSQLKEIVKMRFGIGFSKRYSRVDVGKTLDISPEAVKKREKAALSALRHSELFAELREYL